MFVKSPYFIAFVAVLVIAVAVLLIYRYNANNIVLHLEDEPDNESGTFLVHGKSVERNKTGKLDTANNNQQDLESIATQPDILGNGNSDGEWLNVREKKPLQRKAEGSIGMKPGVDYVENQFIFEASSEEEADKIAKAYGGKLLQFSYSVATAEVEEGSGTTLADVLAKSSDPSNDLPPASLNHIYHLD